ncbi:MAG TPA: hypothetical protein VJI32_05875 [Candidatus Nanoarchaeia archaeon]|nr:hypothetical protein [Candidatus Nanoarchaeia archaeon]
MIHYNSYLQQKGLKGTLQNLILPEIYVASSIKDFVDERGDIQPTGIGHHYVWNFLSLFHNLDLRERAAVVIPSVRYHECFFNVGGLEDLTQRMVAAPIYPEEFQEGIDKEEIKPGETVRALLLYDTKIDFPYLLALFKNTSPQSKKIAAAERFFPVDLILSPV